MSLFSEILHGKPEEIAARERIASGANKSKNARQREADKLLAAQTTRRQLLVGLGATTGVVTLAGTGLLVAAHVGKEAESQRIANEEKNFLADLEAADIRQQVGMVDRFYGSRRFSEELALSTFFPIWFRNYQLTTSSQLTREAVFNTLSLQVSESDNKLGGTVKNDFASKTKSLQINMDYYLNSAPAMHKGIPLPIIMQLRSCFIHELAHFDTVFKDATAFAQWLESVGMMAPALPGTEMNVAKGFSLHDLDKNSNSISVQVKMFEEASADVIATMVAASAGVKNALGYQSGIILNQFLYWKGYDLRKFNQLHQTSNLEQLMKDVGIMYQLENKFQDNEESQIRTGIHILECVNTNDYASIDLIFPGFKKHMETKRPNFIS